MLSVEPEVGLDPMTLNQNKKSNTFPTVPPRCPLTDFCFGFSFQLLRLWYPQLVKPSGGAQ